MGTTTGNVNALAVYDSKLVAAGDFTMAGDKIAPHIASWSKVATAVEDQEYAVPTEFLLRQNYPNPFNPATVIEYEVPRAGHVSLDVYDVLGRRVGMVVDRYESSGRHRVTWNGQDDSGRRVASGVYFYRLRIGDRVESKMMILLK